ncbi:adenosine kinase 2-like isoform X1 [Homarus americanus]|uniref:adenosine kinase 2-like isoform X1 n=1 Tax=Homarus americanus TaxID=6706 RepID=UPI001C476F04|nr:adenosine kinase 2-like isoform X1 [Homarus americanus]
MIVHLLKDWTLPSGENILFGMGNPLLDICVNTKEDFLEKYGLEPNNAILAEDKHQPMYKEMAEMDNVEYIAGGATQNSMRVAQWILRKPRCTTFMGSVGKDEFSETLEKKAKADGVDVRYQKQEDHPTGTCAVVVTKNGMCRSLVANLAAANHFTKSHLNITENMSLLEAAKFYYISGFFLTVSPKSILMVGEHACTNNKMFCMNLSAPFLCEFFKEPMMQAFPYIDVLFSNETEAAKFSEVQGLGSTDVKEIALQVAALPKKNKKRERIVVFTQGADNVILAKDGKITEFPATRLSEENLIDTNGAGDAFVGGFLSQLVQSKSIDACVKCGIWAATKIIQRPGCSFSPDVQYRD